MIIRACAAYGVRGVASPCRRQQKQEGSQAQQQGGRNAKERFESTAMGMAEHPFSCYGQASH
eukprot:5297360-Heterocapsa_arctica.AAC.1